MSCSLLRGQVWKESLSCLMKNHIVMTYGATVCLLRYLICDRQFKLKQTL